MQVLICLPITCRIRGVHTTNPNHYSWLFEELENSLATLSAMAVDRWVPDLVVGVDFGMTCTGLCSNLS